MRPRCVHRWHAGPMLQPPDRRSPCNTAPSVPPAGIWLTAANIIALGFASLLPFVSRMLEESLLRWLRSAELTCDRAALLVSQDPRVVISSLMKMAGGSPALARELSVDAFLAQARSYDEATSSPLGW